MITYSSTRGNKKHYTFLEAILKGIASDGGLLVPDIIPTFLPQQLKKLEKASYQEIAQFVFELFQTGIPPQTLQKIISQAYSSNFSNKQITPVVHLKDNQYVLELWHGPTSAFKDMALQIMPLFFSEALKKENSRRLKKGEKLLRYLILVATSGDTGKAALEGYKDKDSISIMVFYPEGRVSQVQALQMKTQEGNNVAVHAFRGNFDDVQTLVKDIFDDKEFNKKLFKEKDVILSSANSINWGRLIPQIVYHVSSYLDLVDKKVISFGDQIDVVIPSGNFGNCLAAFYAKHMGLPIRKFVCASNKNNVLTEFLQTGIYDISKRTLSKTPSPSMDILIASNIERLLFAITKNPKKVGGLMQKLKINKKFEVDEVTKKILQREFFADWVANEACLQNITHIYDETHYLMDTHTSVAQVVAQRYIKKEKVSLPVVVVSTAHFSKFAKDMYQALQIGGNLTDEFLMLQAIKKFAPKSFIPVAISSLRKKKIRYAEKYDLNKFIIEDKIIDMHF